MSSSSGRSTALPAVVTPFGRRRIFGALLSLLCVVTAAMPCRADAQETEPAQQTAEPAATQPTCLPAGDGYLRARLSGSIRAELDWDNEGTECIGAVRPADGGIRMRFSRPVDEPEDDAATPRGSAGEDPQPARLVLVFGIAGLTEGAHARTVPVNVTVIREGRGQFYSTQGYDKCMLDEVTQQPIVGIPHRSRSYRIVARGFCTEPARAVRGEGAVLLSRFDYAGRVDFDSEDTHDDEPPLTDSPRSNAP